MSVTITGGKETAALLKQMGHRAVHARPAMEKVGGLIRVGERKLWAHGLRGPELAESTVEQKGDDTPGVLTGKLKKSLTEETAEGAVRVFADDHMSYGTSLFWARFMQKGTSVGGQPHEPKRPVLPPRPIKAAREIILEHVLKELR